MKKLLLLWVLAMTFIACKKSEIVTEPPKSSDKKISSFTLLKANNPSLEADVNGIVQASSIKLDIPANVTLREFVATFSLNAKSKLFLGSIEQVSGITKIDFTNPVNFTLKAEDGSTSEFNAQVIKLGNPPFAEANATSS